MSFDQPYNWQGSFVPDNSSAIPCATQFGSPSTTIISTLSAKRYYVGRRLIMPRNGALRLASTGSAISFVPSPNIAQCASTDALAWIGGTTPTQNNDFYCHSNWLLDGSATNTPPCSGSVVQFDTTNTYKVAINPTVNLVVMASISAVGTTASDPNADLSVFLPQINLVNNSAFVYVGPLPTPVCTNRAYMQYTTSGNTRQCACFSSCPTAEMAAQYEDILRTNNNAAAAVDRTAYFANTTRSYAGTYTSVALGVSAQVLANNLNNSAQVDVLAAAVRDAVLGLPSYVASVPQLTAVSGNLRVAGSLTTYNGTLFPPGATSAPTSLTWAATVFPTANVTQLQNLIAATLTPLLLAYQVTVLANQTQTALLGLSSDSLNLVGALTTYSTTPSALTTANSDTCFSSCTDATSCNACASTLKPALAALGLNATAVDAVFTALIGAKGADAATWPATSTQVGTAVNATEQAAVVQQQVQASQPVTRALRSSVLPVGRSRTTADQLRVIMPENRNALMSLFTSTLSSIPGIGNIGNVAVNWVPNYVAASSRRRSVTTASAITVAFDYSVTCAPNDAVCLTPIDPNTALGSTTMTQLNNAFNTLPIVAPTCQSLTGTIGWISSCLNNNASAYCSALVQAGQTEADARTATQQYVYNWTLCGLQPTYPNGTCYDPSQASAATLLAAATASSVACGLSTTALPTTAGNGTNAGAGASTGSSGGIGLPIVAAAAGGGVLLLVLVILLVVRRRRSVGAVNKKEADRTVVAFENPMYDDPTQVQQVYDSGALDTRDGEGLYDEPAFNTKAKKENPLYQSNEDLAGADGAGGDGYLDVAPGQHAAEDVGYLGGEEDTGKSAAEAVYDNGDLPGNSEYSAVSDNFAAAE